MARAQPKTDRRSTEISDLIIAEWYRIVRAWEAGDTGAATDEYSLTVALNEIIESPTGCVAIADRANEPLKIVIPLPPGSTRAELDTYLQNNHEFRDGMGTATLFGCGR